MNFIQKHLTLNKNMFKFAIELSSYYFDFIVAASTNELKGEIF